MMSVVLLSPFLSAQRGNSVTVARLLKGFLDHGINAKAYGFCEQPLEGIMTADIVHGFHAFYFGRYILSCLPQGIPLILTMTGTDYNIDLLDRAKRKSVLAAIDRASKLTVFHQCAKEQLASDVPASREKIEVIPPGVTLSEREVTIKEIFPEDGPIVLIVAGLRRVKNVFLVVEAVRQVRRLLPVNLLHVGPDIEPEAASAVKKAVQDYPWFVSLGEINHNQMTEIYLQADIVVNSSLSEAIPNSILEAMYLNRPVIVSNIPGNLAAVSHNETGLVFSSVEELKEEILLLLTDKQLSRRLGNSAGHFVRRNFSTVNEIESYISLYKELQQPGRGETHGPG